MTLKRIFLTGAAGFIGFHTAKALLARGETVLGYDNFNDYYDPALKRARVAELDTQVIDGDLADRDTLFKTAKQFRPTHIVNLAAQAGVRYSLTNPEVYAQSNLIGFMHILELARDLSLPLTYASSSSVYGTNTKQPFSPTDLTDSPASFYAATKKANELMATSYHHCYGLPVTGLRYFTVYGPWGRPDMAIYKFTKAILNDQPIPIFNNGQMSRDFTYIDDIVAGTLAAIDRESPHTIYNLGNSHPIALLDLVGHIENLLNKKAHLDLLPMQPGEVLSTYADITKSQQELSYNPQAPLLEGLTAFMEWFHSYHSVLTI